MIIKLFYANYGSSRGEGGGGYGEFPDWSWCHAGECLLLGVNGSCWAMLHPAVACGVRGWGVGLVGLAGGYRVLCAHSLLLALWLPVFWMRVVLMLVPWVHSVHRRHPGFWYPYNVQGSFCLWWIESLPFRCVSLGRLIVARILFVIFVIFKFPKISPWKNLEIFSLV